MTNTHHVRIGGEKVRRYIIEQVKAHPTDIARVTSEKFGVTRQAVNRHIQRLVAENALTQKGKATRPVYELAPQVKWLRSFPLAGLKEDRVWLEEVEPSLGEVPANVRSIWQYGLTEMVNNAIDHSEGTTISIVFEKTAATTTVWLLDDGVGIFRKIQRALNLDDERHSVLELSKGKFTTDPSNHSGEGIFFTSRMFDDFCIMSGGVSFSHKFDKPEDWILERESRGLATNVYMELHNHTSRTTKKVFDRFTDDESYGFTKTVVPVRLTEYGDANLVSRSQAKRLLARFDRFKVVMLDFTGVTSIGQSFADEVFRVFPSHHPEVEIVPIHTSIEVRKMISRAHAHT